jgi:DNA-binding NarL/FixJ family response regulator
VVAAVSVSERDLRGLLAVVRGVRGDLPEYGLPPSLLCDRGTPPLTPRHRELLGLVAAGHTNAQISRRLGISAGTVRAHLQEIYSRLQVSSRTAAVTRAFPDHTPP